MSIENGCIEHQYYQKKPEEKVERFFNILLKENSEEKVLF